MRLRSAFLIFSIIIVLITSSIFIVMSFYEIREVEKENAISNLNHLLEDKEGHLNDLITLNKEQLNVLVQSQEFQDFITKYYSMEPISEEEKEEFLIFLETFNDKIFLIDENGKIITSTYDYNGFDEEDIFWGTYEIEDEEEFNFYIYYDDIIKKDFFAASKYFSFDTGNSIENFEKPSNLSKKDFERGENGDYSKSSIENFTGNIVVGISLDNLEKIMQTESDLIRAYIINQDYSLLTPLKFPDRKLEDNLLVQTIDTENSRKCFKHLDELTKKELEHHNTEIEGVVYLDFRGEEVFGTYLSFAETNWCILAEIDAANVYDSHLFVKKSIYLVIALLLAFGFFGYLFGEYLRMKYLDYLVSKDQKKSVKDSRNEFGKFLGNIPLWVWFIVGAVVSFLFLFGILLYFDAFQATNFYDNIPNLAFFVVSFAFIGLSFRFKNYFTRMNLFIGALFLCIFKLLEVFYGIYQFYAVFGSLPWIISYSFFAIGLYFIFIVFCEVLK